MEFSRCERIINKMKQNELDQLIITSTPDIFYILGEWINSGERLMAFYINTDGTKKFIVNDISAGIGEIEGVELVTYNDNDSPINILSEIVNKNKKLGIDKNWPSHFLIELMDIHKDMKFINSSVLVDSVRMIKDDKEKDLMRNASKVVDKVIMDLISYIENNKGVTEKGAAEKLRSIFAKYGTYAYSFDPIIAYGANAADPHAEISDAVLKDGDCIVIDIGGNTDYYCSDTTRTVFFGEPCAEARKIYEVCLKANMTAINMIKPGVKFSDLDKAARKVIEDAGYGEYFTHRTGHCIGIEDHEYPSVSSVNDMEVQAGMTFSIEPGIYIPGKYGVRIEDIILVTEDGREVLNSSPKDLYIIK